MNERSSWKAAVAADETLLSFESWLWDKQCDGMTAEIAALQTRIMELEDERAEK
jgi:hypothetical protein